MAKIDDLFKLMSDHGASDLHLIAGQPPALRINGELERINSQGILAQDGLKELLYEITPAAKKDHFELTGDVDFGYEIPGLARFRANLFNQKYGCGAVFRKIPSKVLTADDLGLPPHLDQSRHAEKRTGLGNRPHGQRQIHHLGGHDRLRQ